MRTNRLKELYLSLASKVDRIEFLQKCIDSNHSTNKTVKELARLVSETNHIEVQILEERARPRSILIGLERHGRLNNEDIPLLIEILKGALV